MSNLLSLELLSNASSKGEVEKILNLVFISRDDIDKNVSCFIDLLLSLVSRNGLYIFKFKCIKIYVSYAFLFLCPILES